MSETDAPSRPLAAALLHRRTLLAAVPAAALMGERATAAVAGATHPDAALLSALLEMGRVAGQQEALQASVAYLAPDDPRHEAAWASVCAMTPAWRAARARASAIPALTVAGLRAKAEAVRSELAVDRDGDPCSDADALMWSLLGDMLRLA